MAFRRQMNHPVYTIVPENFQHPLEIADVRFYESVILRLLHILQIRQITRISQFIQIHDPVLRIFRHKQTHHMRADKTGTARY